MKSRRVLSFLSKNEKTCGRGCINKSLNNIFRVSMEYTFAKYFQPFQYYFHWFTGSHFDSGDVKNRPIQTLIQRVRMVTNTRA